MNPYPYCFVRTNKIRRKYVIGNTFLHDYCFFVEKVKQLVMKRTEIACRPSLYYMHKNLREFVTLVCFYKGI